MVNCIETESTTVATRGWGDGEMGSYCLTGIGLWIGKRKKFWRGTVVEAAQNVSGLNATELYNKNVQNGKFTCVLSHKKGVKMNKFHNQPQTNDTCIYNIKIHAALAGVAQWVGHRPQTEGWQVGFPVRAHAWVVGQVPGRGCMRSNHTLMFLSLFPSFPLSKNK